MYDTSRSANPPLLPVMTPQSQPQDRPACRQTPKPKADPHRPPSLPRVRKYTNKHCRPPRSVNFLGALHTRRLPLSYVEHPKPGSMPRALPSVPNAFTCASLGVLHNADSETAVKLCRIPQARKHTESTAVHPDAFTCALHNWDCRRARISQAAPSRPKPVRPSPPKPARPRLPARTNGYVGNVVVLTELGLPSTVHTVLGTTRVHRPQSTSSPSAGCRF